MPLPSAYFESLFAQNDDPWHFRSRWYEERKRALTMACLPSPRYGAIFEPACANGELSAMLATRCDRLICSDGVPRAVALARARLHALPHVEVRQAWVPGDWPQESFDLVVLSEFLYYLAGDQIRALALRLREGLKPGGVVLGCHWRPRIEGCDIGGSEAHELLSQALAMPAVLGVEDADFELKLWSTDARSVGELAGLR